MLALRDWGALDQNYEYKKSFVGSMRRGFAVDPGGGINSVPEPSEPSALSDVLQSRLWSAIAAGHNYEMQSSIFQPKGGMGMIGKAMGKELGPLIEYNCKVIDIRQDAKGVTATYVDSRNGGEKRTASAGWCICTIPTPILSQIPMNVGPEMKAAIDQLPYMAALKVGLQFKRRFWEEDDQIYGGHTYTNLPNAQIGYPMWDYFSRGKGVLLGAYTFGRPAYIAASKSPEDRIKDALAQGAQIHRSICPSSRTAWPWRGIACPGPLAARAHGPINAETRTITICARWMAASCWRMSMPRACRDGRKDRCSRRWTRSAVCMPG
jgi:monoamine oxidase